ncbi:hypothetical protein CDD83_4744 [Cordyceps sp. RAO-2017]|nr:hypothetical protein CDD83_4744 [Cordyceps sp. RAO-2017]
MKNRRRVLQRGPARASWAAAVLRWRASLAGVERTAAAADGIAALRERVLQGTKRTALPTARERAGIHGRARSTTNAALLDATRHASVSNVLACFLALLRKARKGRGPVHDFAPNGPLHPLRRLD